MKALTIRNLSLQVDIPSTQFHGAKVAAYAKDSIDLINLTLQRGPYDLYAQIMVKDEIKTKDLSIADLGVME